MGARKPRYRQRHANEPMGCDGHHNCSCSSVTLAYESPLRLPSLTDAESDLLVRLRLKPLIHQRSGSSQGSLRIPHTLYLRYTCICQVRCTLFPFPTPILPAERGSTPDRLSGVRLPANANIRDECGSSTRQEHLRQPPTPNERPRLARPQLVRGHVGAVISLFLFSSGHAWPASRRARLPADPR